MKNKISPRRRESNDEFSATAKAASLLRMAIITRLCEAEDSKVSARLMALMSAILKTDPEHIHGERRVENGNLKMLQGFRTSQPIVVTTWHRTRQILEGF